jgi:hypothetical protein
LNALAVGKAVGPTPSWSSEPYFDAVLLRNQQKPRRNFLRPLLFVNNASFYDPREKSIGGEPVVDDE